MSVWEIFLVGVGLSMDAFAVSIVKGLAMPRINRRQLFAIALAFGGFQALMPLTGWLLGSAFAERIAAFDHWIAFVLLALIGGKMIWDAAHEEADGQKHGGVLLREETTNEEAVADGKKLTHRTTRESASPLHPMELLLLAIATSIDALAIGVTFSFLSVEILPAAALIGCTTFTISAAGVVIGHFTGTRFQSRAEAAGGVILIFLGVRILLEHLLS
ncbi:MAG: manganese efflux pump [Lachnospiraceae bacterium]|nr:manganese efflux pump [Lachnospiraceae bacterium]